MAFEMQEYSVTVTASPASLLGLAGPAERTISRYAGSNKVDAWAFNMTKKRHNKDMLLEAANILEMLGAR